MYFPRWIAKQHPWRAAQAAKRRRYHLTRRVSSSLWVVRIMQALAKYDKVAHLTLDQSLLTRWSTLRKPMKRFQGGLWTHATRAIVEEADKFAPARRAKRLLTCCGSRRSASELRIMGWVYQELYGNVPA